MEIHAKILNGEVFGLTAECNALKTLIDTLEKSLEERFL